MYSYDGAGDPMQTAETLSRIRARSLVRPLEKKSPLVRKIDASYKLLSEPPIHPGLVVCDPQGLEDRTTLQNHLLRIEPRLIEMSETSAGLEIVIVSVDKSRQSAINKLGGEDAAGDQAMMVYWDIVGTATAMVGKVNDALALPILRVSSVSDEGISILAGHGLPQDMKLRFSRAVEFVKSQVDLRQYSYTLNLPNGDYDLDLEAFSRVLRNPEMVLSCKALVSGPTELTADEGTGFIMNRVRQLENAENRFFDKLPAAFRVKDRGLGEVSTPFDTSLQKKGISKLNSGVFVEIKLRARDEDAMSLLRFTRDGEGWLGTRKGYMEIFTRRFGMRGFNTYVGKARTNSILSPIAWAMKDVEGINRSTAVMPVNGGHLNYWVGMPEGGFTRELIKKTIERRLECGEEHMAPFYIDLDFEPSLNIIPAKGVDIEEVRARLILQTLERERCGHTLLDKTDFLLNFIENIRPDVQERIFDNMNNGSTMTYTDRKNIHDLKWMCSQRRTIRDTEDAVAVLRKDNELPDEVKSKRKDLENWLFEFAEEKVGTITRLLAEEIRRRAHKK